MSIQTSIIPKSVDLSTETDKKYIDYTPISGTTKKITFGQEAFNNLGLLNLRTTVLEANSSITGATDDFEDIFTDSDGLLNTVNTTDTTSSYDDSNNLYYNPSMTTGVYNTFNAGSATSYDQVEFKSIIDNLLITTIKLRVNYSASGVINIRKNGNIVKTIPSKSYSVNTYATIDVNVLLNTNDVLRLDGAPIFRAVYGMPVNSIITNTSARTFADMNTINYSIIDETTPTNKEIVLTYNKANPKGLYFMPYSSDTGTNEVGDVTLSLYTDTTLLGEFNPYQIYEGLTLASTPNKAVINQKDTSISKITKYVLLIED